MGMVMDTDMGMVRKTGMVYPANQKIIQWESFIKLLK
jgi:hypothetical protein